MNQLLNGIPLSGWIRQTFHVAIQSKVVVFLGTVKGHAIPKTGRDCLGSSCSYREKYPDLSTQKQLQTSAKGLEAGPQGGELDDVIAEPCTGSGRICSVRGIPSLSRNVFCAEGAQGTLQNLCTSGNRLPSFECGNSNPTAHAATVSAHLPRTSFAKQETSNRTGFSVGFPSTSRGGHTSFESQNFVPPRNISQMRRLQKLQTRLSRLCKGRKKKRPIVTQHIVGVPDMPPSSSMPWRQPADKMRFTRGVLGTLLIRDACSKKAPKCNA